MSDALEIALRMTPQEREEIYALALGFGNMLMAQHRAEHDAFAARWPGVLLVRWGYPLPNGRWSRSRRFFSVSLTRDGMHVAFFVESRGLRKAQAKTAP